MTIFGIAGKVYYYGYRTEFLRRELLSGIRQAQTQHAPHTPYGHQLVTEEIALLCLSVIPQKDLMPLAFYAAHGGEHGTEWLRELLAEHGLVPSNCPLN